MNRASASRPTDLTAARDGAPREDRVFWLLMGAALLLGLCYNGAILTGFGPDEPRHFAYIKLLATQHALPYQLPGGAEYGGAHSYHPPLYYLILAPFYLLLSGAPAAVLYHGLRLVSLALCLGALPLIYQIAWRAGGGNRLVARFAVAVVALLPLFGMTGGILNNDAALLFFVTLFIWALTVRFADDRSLRAAVIVGVIFALGALSKATALICDSAALLFWLWVQNGKRAPLCADFWKRGVLIMAVALLICGPWYARNRALYGTLQPVPAGFTNPALPAPSNGPLVMAMHPNFPFLLGYANRGIFDTLWAQRDWLMQRQTTPPSSEIQPVQGAIYLALLAFVGAAALGHLRRKSGADETEAWTSAQRRLSLGVPYIVFGIAWIACLQVALFVHWGQAEGGRYLLPGIAGLAIFVARGYQMLLGKRAHFALISWGLGALAINALSLYWLLAYLNPTYGAPS